MRADDRPVHWCWVAPRVRVARLGHALDCFQCRRYRAKHRCGAVSDYETALLDYPIDECAACATRYKRGDFPTGPKDAVPHKEPAPAAPEKRETMTRAEYVESRRSRAETRQAKQRRRMLVLLMCSRRACRLGELLTALRAFGAVCSDRTLRVDIAALVHGRWLVRHKARVELAKRSPAWLQDEQWHYTVNPSITARLEGLSEGNEVQSV